MAARKRPQPSSDEDTNSEPAAPSGESEEHVGQPPILPYQSPRKFFRGTSRLVSQPDHPSSLQQESVYGDGDAKAKESTDAHVRDDEACCVVCYRTKPEVSLLQVCAHEHVCCTGCTARIANGTNYPEEPLLCPLCREPFVIDAKKLALCSYCFYFPACHEHPSAVGPQSGPSIETGSDLCAHPGLPCATTAPAFHALTATTSASEHPPSPGKGYLCVFCATLPRTNVYDDAQRIAAYIHWSASETHFSPFCQHEVGVGFEHIAKMSIMPSAAFETMLHYLRMHPGEPDEDFYREIAAPRLLELNVWLSPSQALQLAHMRTSDDVHSSMNIEWHTAIFMCCLQGMDLVRQQQLRPVSRILSHAETFHKHPATAGLLASFMSVNHDVRCRFMDQFQS